MPKFTPRDKKQRRARSRASHKSHSTATEDGENDIANSNALMLIPKTVAEKSDEAQRRQELKAELSQGLTKISSKKQKRLDKYIDNKLKKEERVALIHKLAGEKIDTASLTSTKDLGVTKISKREQLRRALRDQKDGIDLDTNHELLYEPHEVIPYSQDAEKLPDAEAQASSQDLEPKHQHSTTVVVGSGLKRARGTDSLPTLGTKRKKTNCGNAVKNDSDEKEEHDDAVITDGGPWTGFDSDDSEGSDEENQDEEAHLNDAENGLHSSSARESKDEDSDTSETSSSAESSDDSQESEEEEDRKTTLRKMGGKSEKASAFKQWAMAQRGQLNEQNFATKENDEDKSTQTIQTSTATIQASTKLNAPIISPKKATKNHKNPRSDNTIKEKPEDPIPKKKAFAVNISRSDEIQNERYKLPIVAEEQMVMEAIHGNDVVILCGETGSGKTTQVPQFLFEAGYGDSSSETPGLIGVTQPRRVAAVSMSRRVGNEMGELGKKVGYQIRFEGDMNENTAIKFMTDGVLIREVSDDFLLKKYSAIIIDEAHERSVNTDILIGTISRVVKLRREMSIKEPGVKPLKIIIMSATLRVSDFAENKLLFPNPPPIVKVEARQHKVTNRFSLRTRPDYLEEAFKKVSKIHQRLPKGGILVFLTGQNEIATLSRRLRKAFDKTYKPTSEPNVQILAKDAVLEVEDIDFGVDDSEDLLLNNIDSGEESEESDLGEDEMEGGNEGLELVVLPLYSLLNTKEQMKVFEPLSENQRLCVLATNVAETSLTIPGIRYVVDTGRVKERTSDRATGVQSFDIHWISKASAAQRSGRAGRTGPGNCYRLYSSAVFERDFPDFTTPEIQRMPIDSLVLQMKSMHIQKISNFPFPTPPAKTDISAAEKLLNYMGALDSASSITELGRTMSMYPVTPRFSRILTIAHQHGCMPYAIAIVSALSVGDLFVPEAELGFSLNEHESEGDPRQKLAPDFSETVAREKRKIDRKKYFNSHLLFASMDKSCDFLKTLTAVCGYEYEKDQKRFCDDNYLRFKAMKETRRLREQLTKIVRGNFPEVTPPFKALLEPPNHLQKRVLKHIIGIGYIDQIAIRGDLLPNSPLNLKGMKNMSNVPYFTLQSTTTGSKNTPEDLLRSAVYVHPSSILAMDKPKEWPQYIAYSELQRSSSGTGKVRMKPLTALTGQQLSFLAMHTPLITYSKPLHHPQPQLSALENGYVKRECWVVPQFGAAIGKAELGWSLPPRRVTQLKAPGSSQWVVQLEQQQQQ